jgi:hypothetical protein
MALQNDIAIAGLYIFPTYRGLLLGTPDEEMDKRLISDAEQKAAKQFGLPVYVVKPDVKLNRLPDYTILAELEMFEIEGDFDGRTLTIVLFVDNIYSMPIDQIIDNNIQELDWKKHSKLWSF